MKAKFNFTISGLLISIVLLSLFATIFSLFIADINAQYGLAGDNMFGSYDQTQEIVELSDELQESTNIGNDPSFTDIVGAYFQSGYIALKTSIKGVDLTTSMLNTASGDSPYISIFISYITIILIIAISVGVVIAALVKLRV